MNKQPNVTAQTRQNLIDAFWSFYCEKRIDTITVKAIAARAGYNRATFYEYFTDVYAVLEQIESSLVPDYNELPPVIMPEEQKDYPLDLFVKLYEKNSAYYSVLLGDNGDPSFAAKLKNAVKPMLKLVLNEKADVAATELDYILEYMLSAMIGIMSYWFRNNMNIPPERLIELMYDMTQNGVMVRIRRN